VGILRQSDAPAHLFNIPELDFSETLFVERLNHPWVRLGALSVSRANRRGPVEEEYLQNTLLLAPGAFAAAFDAFGAVGNVLWMVAKPGLVHSAGQTKYEPFYQFHIAHPAVTAEPLVVPMPDADQPQLFINPDLWLFLELKEQNAGSGIWHDPRRLVDALVRRREEDLEVVEIRTEYLLRYLQARQMSLLVALYRQFLFFDPPAEARNAFVKEDLTLGAPGEGVKAILENWGLRQEALGEAYYLQRRLHLWYQIEPPERSAEVSETSTFDVFSFTLPTDSGPVAPARWKNVPNPNQQPIAGVDGGFMDSVYFRQEVLTKYEGTAGYTVSDDGSVSCSYYWALSRSTCRIGNELVSTSIGDFGQGVPVEEWPHWRQYAVEPPDAAGFAALRSETKIPEAVNGVLDALQRLNAAFFALCNSAGVLPTTDLWQGSRDGLAARQLKWVYRTGADDDEFLKRATLASTLFLDGLTVPPVREFLSSLGERLHQSFDKAGNTLGSRNLLQRLTLIVMILERLRPTRENLAVLVEQAEGKRVNAEPDLQAELEDCRKQAREIFAPLAFLYDLRVSGGWAHPPNKEDAKTAAEKLGLPAGSWHRTHFLQLLKLIEDSLDEITDRLEIGARVLREQAQSRTT
jgi:hypothetical protein